MRGGVPAEHEGLTDAAALAGELERALGRRPGWADYTAMLRERETEHLLGYDDSQPSISYDADPFQATPTWSAGAGHGAGYGAGI